MNWLIPNYIKTAVFSAEKPVAFPVTLEDQTFRVLHKCKTVVNLMDNTSRITSIPSGCGSLIIFYDLLTMCRCLYKS